MYNLCIDIGNTRIKYGIFLKNDLIEIFYNEEDILYIFSNFNISKSLISNVRKEIPKEISDLTSGLNVNLILSHFTKLPLRIVYDTPETLGMDRVAAAVGANHLFPDQNCIIIDAGTCITMDFVNKENIFLGGNISPGISTRIKAMNYFTGKLPLVEIEMPDELLAKNTMNALQNGAVRGTIWEISAFIDEIISKFGKTKVVFTGGDTKYFVNFIKTPIFADQNLVLLGLNVILNNYE